MLVLSRKKNEEIVITAPGQPPITVCVVEIRGDKARLGIDAPLDVRVDRREIAAIRQSTVQDFRADLEDGAIFLVQSVPDRGVNGIDCHVLKQAGVPKSAAFRLARLAVRAWENKYPGRVARGFSLTELSEALAAAYES